MSPREPRWMTGVVGGAVVVVAAVATALVWPARAPQRGSSTPLAGGATATPAAAVAPTPGPGAVATPPATAASVPRESAPSTTSESPPSPTAPSGAKRVFIVGDSLTVGTEPWLGADLGRLGWSMTGVDARVGRGVAEGLAVLRLRAASLPPTVVVALGTNDYGDDPTVVVSWLRSVRAVAGGRRVVWVNLCPDDAIAPRLAPYRRINAALTRDGPAFGVQVADWCAFAGRNGLTPGPDGVHYRSAAYQQRAAFYADLVAGITP